MSTIFLQRTRLRLKYEEHKYQLVSLGKSHNSCSQGNTQKGQFENKYKSTDPA